MGQIGMEREGSKKEGSQKVIQGEGEKRGREGEKRGRERERV